MDKFNFFKNTTAVFQKVKRDIGNTHICFSKPADFISLKQEYIDGIGYVDFESSKYWYAEEGVYRYSDHWASVGSCYWRIKGADPNGINYGFCKWEDFKQNKIN